MRNAAIEINRGIRYSIPMKKELDTGLLAGITSFLSDFAQGIQTYCDTYVDGIINELATHGFKFLGAGSYRIALTHPTIPGVVFKLSYSGASYDICKYMGHAEYKFYTEEATSSEKRFLAEALHADDYVAAMEYVEDDGSLTTTIRYNGFRHFTKVPKRKQYSDAYRSNYAMREGNPILYDYTPATHDWDYKYIP